MNARSCGRSTPAALPCALHDRGILYAPGDVINAGGPINVALAHSGRSVAEIRRHIVAIGHTLAGLFEWSRVLGLPPEQIAVRRAEAILQQKGERDEQACRAV